MYTVAFSKSLISSFSGGPSGTYALGTISDPSLKIINMCNRGVSIFQGTQQIDYIGPYQYLIMQNQAEISLQLDTQSSVSYLFPNANVSVASLPYQAGYQTGQLLAMNTQAPSASMDVSGSSVSISNAPGVYIQGTPTVALQGGAVSINGTPSVNATITNTPTTTVRYGTSVTQSQNPVIFSNVSIPANGVAPMQFTQAFSLVNAKGVQLFIDVTNTLGFSSDVYLKWVLFGYQAQGGTNYQILDSSGAQIGYSIMGNGSYAYDNGTIQQLLSGYNAITLGVYLVNNTASAVTAGAIFNLAVGIQS